MKSQRLFDIEIYKLGNKKHYYDYELDSSFFESFEDSFIEKGSLKVKLCLDKSESHILSNFQIEGFVELICDRSLETFDFKVGTNDNLIFKFGIEFSELTEEIITIPRETQKLNVAQYIYEFIGLSVPMKKLHPRFQEEEDEDSETESILIYSTERNDVEEEDLKDNETDPRWDILNKIKKK